MSYDLGFIDPEQKTLPLDNRSARDCYHVLATTSHLSLRTDRSRYGSGGGTRTPDTRIMIPASYVEIIRQYGCMSHLCRVHHRSRKRPTPPFDAREACSR